MQVDPQRLADHLAGLYIRGAKGIETVLLRDRFTCVARTMDSSLLVAAPELEGVEPLPQEVGVDLRTLIGTLWLPEFGERREGKWVGLPTDLSVTSGRLVIKTQESSGWIHRLFLVQSSTVESHVDLTVAQRLFSQVPDGPGMLLNMSRTGVFSEDAWQWIQIDDAAVRPAELTKTIPALAELLRAREVILKVGPKGGIFYIERPDDINGDATYIAEIHHHLTAEQPYKLTFDVRPLVDVLGKLRHATEPRIHLAGPRKPVLFTTDTGFRYLLRSHEVLRTLP